MELENVGIQSDQTIKKLNEIQERVTFTPGCYLKKLPFWCEFPTL